MSFYTRFATEAHTEALTPEETSYFSQPEETLDPHLFAGDRIIPRVRQGILSTLYQFWEHRYRDARSWSTVWLAGSGASYQWSAARDPGDLDVLVGVDWVQFRRSNPDFVDLSDQEIANYLNQELVSDLWPETSNFMGAYEATFYINVATDIRDIVPYAAYDLTHDSWTVHPNPSPVNVHPGWDLIARQDTQYAQEIVDRYNKALTEWGNALGDGDRLNTAIKLRNIAREGARLFDDIHEGRHAAYSPGGGGYNSLQEYRYKAAKGSGVINALKDMKHELAQAELEDEQDTYGYAFPDANRSLVEAALWRRYRGQP